MNATPHDALFKSTFSDPARAMDELRAVAPEQLVRHLDLASAEHVSGSFVDEALRQRHTDVLHRVKLAGRDAFAYLLLEHQSEPDPLMPYRLLRYMVRIWERWLEQTPDAKSLPIILPLVLSHAPQGWTAPRSMNALYDAPAQVLDDAGPWVPDFEFAVDDLSQQSDEALRGRTADALAKLVVMLLKHARTKDEISSLVLEWIDLVQTVVKAPSGVAALGRVMRYVLLVDRKVEPGEFGRLLELAAGPRAKEAFVTAGQMLIEQGREQGIAKGIEQGIEQTLRRQLGLRFGTLPAWVETRIAGASRAALQGWADRILTARSVEEVFAD